MRIVERHEPSPKGRGEFVLQFAFSSLIANVSNPSREGHGEEEQPDADENEEARKNRSPRVVIAK